MWLIFDIDARAECNAKAPVGNVFNTGVPNADHPVISHGYIL